MLKFFCWIIAFFILTPPALQHSDIVLDYSMIHDRNSSDEILTPMDKSSARPKNFCGAEKF